MVDRSGGADVVVVRDDVVVVRDDVVVVRDDVGMENVVGVVFDFVGFDCEKAEGSFADAFAVGNESKPLPLPLPLLRSELGGI